MTQWTEERIVADLVAIVQRFVQDPPGPLGADTHLVRDLGLESVDIMDIVTEVEDHFGVNFPLNKLPELETIGDTAKALVALLQEDA